MYQAPRRSAALFVCAHGAGAGMRHRFLESLAAALVDRDVATLRYQFPYMEAGRKAPDRAPVLEATVRAAVSRGRELAGGAPLLAGGKSMGGRMTSRAHAADPLPGVRGIVFLGFPLHRPGRAGDLERAEHLGSIELPMLMVQGTRDRLAELDEIRRVERRLARRVTVHVVEGGDHSFAVLKRSGRDPGEVIAEIAGAVSGWIATLD